MKTHSFPASQRGTKDIGWLKSKFVFSFSEFYDPMLSSFGTLVAFNDDKVEAGKGFGIHPHVNMEIIWVLMKGKMNHKDTMGYNTEVEKIFACMFLMKTLTLFHVIYFLDLMLNHFNDKAII